MASIPSLFCRRRVTQEKDSQIHKTYSQIVKSVFRKDDLSYLHILKKTEKKEFKELSEEQLKEVTGGKAAGLGMCDIDLSTVDGVICINLNPQSTFKVDSVDYEFSSSDILVVADKDALSLVSKENLFSSL